MIRNRTVREALQFTAPSGSTDFHSFHRPPKKEKRSKKERNGCYYDLSNSPLTPEGEYYKGFGQEWTEPQRGLPLWCWDAVNGVPQVTVQRSRFRRGFCRLTMPAHKLSPHLPGLPQVAPFMRQRQVERESQGV